VTVASEAPLHVKRCDPRHERHAVHGAMTRAAADSLGNVDRVIEVDKVGQVVHAVPAESLSAREAVPQQGENGRCGEELRMTRHAGRQWGYAGKGSCVHGAVAVAAIDAVVSRVMLVAEGYRLFNRRVARRVRRDGGAPTEDGRSHQHAGTQGSEL